MYNIYYHHQFPNPLIDDGMLTGDPSLCVTSRQLNQNPLRFTSNPLFRKAFPSYHNVPCQPELFNIINHITHFLRSSAVPGSTGVFNERIAKKRSKEVEQQLLPKRQDRSWKKSLAPKTILFSWFLMYTPEESIPVPHLSVKS